MVDLGFFFHCVFHSYIFRYQCLWSYVLGFSKLILTKGLKQKHMVFNGKMYRDSMPGNDFLVASEITLVINYLNTSWENNLPEIEHQAVKEALGKCKNSTE